MSTQLGLVLKDARKKKQITLRDLGTELGSPPSFLSELENGIRPAPKDDGWFARLAEVLGISKSYLIELAQEERERRNPRILRDLFKKDHELASCFYRISNDLSEQEFRNAFLEFLQNLEREGK